MKKHIKILAASFKLWTEDKTQTMSAALSYYTVFSLGPLLLIVIGAAGLIFGRDAVEGQIYEQLKSFLGSGGAKMIETMVQGASKPKSGILSIILGGILLLLSASGVFGQLKQSLNSIWKVEPKPGRGLVSTLRERILSFGMVAVIAFLLTISFVASAMIGAIATYFTGFLPVPPLALEMVNIFLSLGLITLLFACIYKVLPDVVLRWKVVLRGAICTAILFTIGKTIIGLYIGNSAASSTYGAAASFVVILLWVYYAALILFFGAEYAKAYALEEGIEIKPGKFGQFSEPLITPEELKPVDETPQNAAATFFGYVVQGFVQRILTEKKINARHIALSKKRSKKVSK